MSAGKCLFRGTLFPLVRHVELALELLKRKVIVFTDATTIGEVRVELQVY